MIIGVDECGRGSWAGPVVAAAVGWGTKAPRCLLRDSKKLSPTQRQKSYEVLMKAAENGSIVVGVGIIAASVIDDIGIRSANREAMLAALRSIEGAKTKLCTKLLIDGRDGYAFDDLHLPDPTYIIRGDSREKTIMAASIIAKVTRDTLMCDAALRYGAYGFERHKGYGTKIHEDALEHHGPCPIHRASYRPIQKYLSSPLGAISS